MLADSHCHLDSFENPAGLLLRAKKEGVEYSLTNATSLDSIKNTIALAKEFKSVKAALGIHPENVLEMDTVQMDAAFSLIEKNLKTASAIGEVGLDFKYAKTTAQRKWQEKVFGQFISLAMEKELAIVVHARYAETQCLDILEQMKAKNVHMHWFTNSKRTSGRAVGLGYKISCGPIIFVDAQSQGVVSAIPLENLMLETDAPVQFGEKTSEPSWIPKVCEKVAQLKRTKPEEVAAKTWENFISLYR